MTTIRDLKKRKELSMKNATMAEHTGLAMQLGITASTLNTTAKNRKKTEKGFAQCRLFPKDVKNLIQLLL